MQYDILHETPGRMRVHCRTLRRDPDCRIALDRWREQHADLLSVSVSTRTGNLLLVYSRNMSRKAVLVMLDNLQLFGVASIDRGEGARRKAPAEAAYAASCREMSRLVVNAVIPGPLRGICAAWRLVRGLFRLVDRLFSGQFSAFLYELGKFSALALLGGSAPVGFLLRVGFAVGECLTPEIAEVAAMPLLSNPVEGYGEEIPAAV